jgi:hypothetical protein
MDFDFDAWAKLAKDDPAEFERRRERMVRDAIDRAPPAFRQRLEGLQCALDLERKRSVTPLASCVRMNSLMWIGFYRLRKQLMAKAPDASRAQTEPRRSAQVIPLRSGRDRTMHQRRTES